MLRTLLLALLLVAVPVADAFQALDERALNLADRQISAYIREVFQDREGHYWFGTNGDGVTRYDGESFTTSTHTSGLSRNHAQSIYLDRDGRLWLGCSGGLYRFDNGALINITKDGPCPG